LLAKIFKGIWTGINFSRRLVLNILFLLLVILFFVAITGEEDQVKVADGTVLRLNLNGPIVEEKTYVDPVEAAINDATMGKEAPSEILLDDVIEVINEATKDDRITVMLLDLQKMPSAHINKLKQITKAIDAFKDAGKQVIATGYYYTQAQYYIAAHANEVSMHPYGGVSIEGYGMFPLYFKDALEKLKVTQHIFRVGTYKSAVEPFIRNDMSDAAKEANSVWLTALWNEYKTDVAASRPFDESNFDEDMDVYLAKIERAEAVETVEAIDDIVLASDAVMVARGDLGVEIGDAALVGKQKLIISRARSLNRTVVTATQMMESMIDNPMPTRAEVMDVANAVLDGTDAVMLSAETAAGDYPEETVATMARVCLGAESQKETHVSKHRLDSRFSSNAESIALSAMYAANHLDSVKAIVTLTESGSTAKLMSPWPFSIFASRVNFAPTSRFTLPSLNVDTRILGPCKSARIATCLPKRLAMLRTASARSL
jgi:ClpP class serine protease